MGSSSIALGASDLVPLGDFVDLQVSDDRQASVVAFDPWVQTRAWHVLHVKSRQEKALALDLERLGVAHFLPLVEKVTVTGGRRFHVSLPLFPGYMFLRGGRDEAIQADRTRRLVTIIDVKDQKRLAYELENIRMALDGGAELAPHHLPQKGWKVVVREGPFQGLQGVVENCLSMHRLILQVNLLGQAVSMEVGGEYLEVLSRA